VGDETEEFSTDVSNAAALKEGALETGRLFRTHQYDELPYA